MSENEKDASIGDGRARRKQDKKNLQESPDAQFEGGDDELPSSPKKSLGQVLLELKKMKEEEEDRIRREEERVQTQQALAAIGITQQMIQDTSLRDMTELTKVRVSFRFKFQNLMTNVLKIALQLEEEMLACVITAFYEVNVEQEMIIKALSMNNF